MDTSEFRKPRPDFPIVPQSALLRQRVKGFRVPKGRRGKKPRGKAKRQKVLEVPPQPDRFKEAQIQEIRDNSKDRRERLRLEQEISRETIRYREVKADREERQRAVRVIEGRRVQARQDRLIQDQARHFTELLDRGERRAGEVQAQYQEFIKQVLSQRNLEYDEPDIQFFPTGGSLFEEEEESVVVSGLRKPEVVRPSPAVAKSFKQAGFSGDLNLSELAEELEAGSPPAGLPDPSPLRSRGDTTPKQVIQQTTFAERAGIGEVKPISQEEIDLKFGALSAQEQAIPQSTRSSVAPSPNTLKAVQQLRETISQPVPTGKPQPSPREGQLFRELEKAGETSKVLRSQSRGRQRIAQAQSAQERITSPIGTRVVGELNPDRLVLSPTTGLRQLGSDEESIATSPAGLTYEESIAKFGTVSAEGARIPKPQPPAKTVSGRTVDSPRAQAFVERRAVSRGRTVRSEADLRSAGFRGASPEPEPQPQPEPSPAQQLKQAGQKLRKKVRRSGTPKPKAPSEEDTTFLSQAKDRYLAEQGDRKQGSGQSLEQVELSDRYLGLIGVKDKPVKYSKLSSKLGERAINLTTQSEQDVYLRINEKFDTAGAGKSAGVYKLRQLPASQETDTDARNKKIILQSVFGTGKSGAGGALEDIATINPYKITRGVNPFEKALEEGKIQFFLKPKEEEVQP
tara:strand:- start:2403 stop:4454 length:2052 start_codon:yes stop_codon:yes gene_type:complete